MTASRLRWATRGAIATLAALVLVACGPTEPSVDNQHSAPADSPAPINSPVPTDIEREPAPAVDPPRLERDDALLPLQFESSHLVDPGWEVRPQHLDGVFLAPVETSGYLTFTAIDSEGSALWAAQRPLACAGFTLTRGLDGMPLAVLSDAAPSAEGISATTVTAYNLLTGALEWGPIEVPGPHQGPGLVYAAPSAEAMGTAGPRVALSATTGEIVVDERNRDVSIVAEHHGNVLLHDNEQLLSIDHEHSTVWEEPLPGTVDAARATPDQPADAGVIALGVSGQPSTAISWTTGEVVSPGVTSLARDGLTDTIAVVDNTHLRALNATTGEVLWEQPRDDGTRIVSAGGAHIYVRAGDTVRVHNSVTGALLTGYDPGEAGTIMVPVEISQSGAAVFVDNHTFMLAALPSDGSPER